MLPEWNRVLVATDFSDTAEAALPYAYALAKPGGEVHLLHVIEHEDTPNPLYAHFSPDDLARPEQRAAAIKEVERHLLERVPAGAVERSVTTIAGCVLARDVAEGIVQEAQRRKVDAVVLGSHGRTGVAHLLMGSVAEEVLRRAGMPVLIVPRHG